LTAAIGDMQTAYTTTAGLTDATSTELGSGNIGGLTIAPGLYKWSTDVTIPTDVTLSGGSSDVWVFQISGNLSIASATKIILSGGALASNVFWQVGGGTGVTIGTTATFEGTILSVKQVIMNTGSVLNGRALAQTGVTLDHATITNTAFTLPSPAVLHVIESVVNSGIGSATSSDFRVYVKNAGVNVSNSPLAGTTTPGTAYTLPMGTYTVSQDASSSYSSVFSGYCDSNGNVTMAGNDETCTITNTYIPIVPPTTPTVYSSVSSGSSSSGGGQLTAAQLAAILAPGSTTTAYLASLGKTSSSVSSTVTSNCPTGFVCALNLSKLLAFARDLKVGMIGADVKDLQVFLNSHGYAIAASGAGSPNNETSYFGSLTKKALIRFQTANGISATGYFGSITRGHVNGVSSATAPVTPVATTSISITDSGSTNTAGFVLTINADGSGTLNTSQSHSTQASIKQIPAGTLRYQTLKLDIEAVPDLLVQGQCAKSVSFGSTETIVYNGQKSGDVSCPSTASSSQSLSQEVSAIIAQAKAI
jgi:peptidoglycan hydrolase-like protein with peptidoglycan-binding domain